MIYEHLLPFNNRLQKWAGDFGVEIETETKSPYQIPAFSFWEIHQDGSLRDFGQEYVLHSPVKFPEILRESLEEFRDKTSGIKFKKDSVTTSVHVHINFLNDTWLTLFNFITAYVLVENLLVRYSGETRISNNFCLPICDSEDTFHNITRMVKGVRDRSYRFLQFSPDTTKYGALNVGSLYSKGSLEIRCFRGTTDIDEIFKWCSILNSIKQFAKSPGLNPIVLVKDYDRREIEILNDIFNDYRQDISHIDEKFLVEKNLWYAASIAHSCKKWEELDEIPEKPSKKSKKDLDKVTVALFGPGHTFTNLNSAQQRSVLDFIDIAGTAEDDGSIGVWGQPATPMRVANPRNTATIPTIDWQEIRRAGQPTTNVEVEEQEFVRRVEEELPDEDF